MVPLGSVKYCRQPAGARSLMGGLAQSLDAFKFTPCAADFSLLNLPKGKSLGRSKPATNS